MARKTLALTMLLLVSLLSFGLVAAQDVAPEVTPEVTPEVNLENVTANHETFYGQEVTLNGVIQEFVNARTFVLGEGAALDDDKVLVINNSNYELYLWIQKNVPVTVTGVVYPSINQGGLGQIAGGSPGVMTATDEALAPGLSVATLEPTLEGDLSGDMSATREATLPAASDMSATETMSDDMSATEDMPGEPMVTAESMTLEVAAPPAGDMTATDEMSGDMGATEEMIAQPTVAPTEMAPTPEPVDFSTMTLPAEYGDYTIIVLSSVDAVVYVEPAAQ